MILQSRVFFYLTWFLNLQVHVVWEKRQLLSGWANWEVVVPLSSQRQSVQSSAVGLAKAKIQHQKVASGNLGSAGDAFCHDLTMSLARDPKWEKVFPFVWKPKGFMQALITHHRRRMLSSPERQQRSRAKIHSLTFIFLLSLLFFIGSQIMTSKEEERYWYLHSTRKVVKMFQLKGKRWWEAASYQGGWYVDQIVCWELVHLACWLYYCGGSRKRSEVWWVWWEGGCSELSL